MAYEYKTVVILRKDLDKTLEELGKDDWCLCTCIPELKQDKPIEFVKGPFVKGMSCDGIRIPEYEYTYRCVFIREIRSV